MIHGESTAVISSADPTSQDFQLRYSKSQTILATALVPVLNGQNELVFCRALLDSGAESSFITEDCLQRLNLKSRKRNFTIQGVGNENLAQSNVSVDLTLGQDCDLKVKCAVVTKITNALPIAYFPTRDWCSLKNVKSTDPNFNIPKWIDLLLGRYIQSHRT